MYLAEYQVKEILARYGVKAPKGALAREAGEAESVAGTLGVDRFVVKAQVTAGGRGLAGGVTFADTPADVRAEAAAMLGSKLVTTQTGPRGEKIEAVYVEEAVRIAESLYVALVIDQRSALPSLLASREGGVDFEEKAGADPDILRTLPLTGDGDVSGIDIDGFFGDLGLDEAAAGRVASMARGLIRAFFECDATLIEINPLALTESGEALAVDAKMIVDGAALFRHPEFEAIAKAAHVDEHERVAQTNDINFVRLEGNIGVVVNGAGLGLATNDLIVEKGGSPANFMDIRTTATSFQIARGIALLLEDPKIKVLLVNVHGGGMTVCDTVVEGLNFAYARAAHKPPIVYRGAGQNAPWALTMMEHRRLPFEKADTMSHAAERAVAIAKGA